MANQKIDLDITPGKDYSIIHCSQGDVGRKFIISLYDENEKYTPPAGATFGIYGKKADKKIFEYEDNLTVTDNNIVVTLQEQMTTTAGPVNCEIRIFKDKEVLGTANFILLVEGGVLDGIFSKSELEFIDLIRAEVKQNLEIVIENTQETIKQSGIAQAAASNAAESATKATEAKAAAEAAAEIAQTAGANVESYVIQAQQARDEAQGYSINAENYKNETAAYASAVASNAYQVATNTALANTSATNAANAALTAQEAAQKAEKFNKVSVYEVGISTSLIDKTTHILTWTLPESYGITKDSYQELIPPLAEDSESIQDINNLVDAQIYDAGQDTNTLYLYVTNIPSYSDVPAFNFRLVVRGR